MALPLYRGVVTPEYGPELNTGLWYDKFCNQWSRNGIWWNLETAKSKWINQLDGREVGSAALLEEASTRLADLVFAAGGQVRCFGTSWRFLTGIGREHPVENGFAWHHTLGVPFIPGASVKGLVRHWAEAWAGEAPAVVHRVFGKSEGDNGVGSIVFFDALPLAPVRLEADVMTPHYSTYYRDESSAQPPADWDDPNPIPFLTVGSGQTFMFGLAPRRAGDESDTADVELALNWVGSALSEIGAGAKTAAGYGRFRRKTDREMKTATRNQQGAGNEKTGKPQPRGSQPEESAVRTDLSSLRQEMEQDGYGAEPERFMAALTGKWLSRMEAGETSPEDRREIAAWLAEWYQVNKPDQWKKPKGKKNRDKVKRIKAVLNTV